jgi:putative redox protein
METERSVTVHVRDGKTEAVNRRGARLRIDPDGVDGFTPVELLLASLGSCGAIDVELLMGKQRDPVEEMTVTVTGHKIDHRLHDLRVTYVVAGEHDPRKIDRALTKTGDDLCTVSRTLRSGAEVAHAFADG